MNKKGFTLIELLAVIIILSLLVVLVSTSVTKLVTNSKKELSDRQIILIKKAAETWGADNIYKLPSEDNECKYLTLEDLQTYGVIDSNIIDPKNNKEISSDINIKISASENKYNNVVINYEVDTDISTCEPIYPKICTLVSDSDKSNSITEGDKYQCKVKDDMEEGFENGYYFHILSFNEDGSVNLIMDRNMYYDSTNDIGVVATETNKGLVAWYADTEDHSYGPVTALQYLHNATKDWNNIPSITIKYEDENIKRDGDKGTNGYGKIITNGNITKITKNDGMAVSTIENLKVRLPKYEEVRIAGCTTDKGSCPLWLVNYLYQSTYSSNYYSLENGKIVIGGINGYWTFSSIFGETINAWTVDFMGLMWSGSVDKTLYYGVRPVITIPKYNLSNKIK